MKKGDIVVPLIDYKEDEKECVFIPFTPNPETYCTVAHVKPYCDFVAMDVEEVEVISKWESGPVHFNARFWRVVQPGEEGDDILEKIKAPVEELCLVTT